jgi:pimeloyl-ACP methyl ester carboxylesterase
VEIATGRRRVFVQPGRPLTVEVNPFPSSPELRLAHEAGFAVPIQAGSSKRSAYLSVVKNLRQRLAVLNRSTNRLAAGIAGELERAIADQAEEDVPILHWLNVAEGLSEGRLRLDELPEVPLVRHRQSIFRVASPAARGSVRSDATVLLAFPGIGHNENSFFDSYGRGSIVRQALSRGWLFVASRRSPSAVSDVLDWLKTVRGIRVARLFVMGHGQGAGDALSAAAGNPKPAAAALFAPAFTVLVKDWLQVPIFLSVGRKDGSRVVSSAISLAREMQGRADFKLHELETCEHLMVVADSVGAAFAFFDGVAQASHAFTEL